MHRGMSRWVIAAFAFLGAFVLCAGVASAASPSITAIVTGGDKAPIAGVSVSVTGPEGFTGSGTTDAEGRATIEVPAAGQYIVKVDEKTLPPGETVKDGPERTVNVLSGDKKALFPVGVGGEPAGGEDSGSGAGEFGAQVLQLIVDGVVLSLIIALGALGLNLIFGTTGLTNFAHGELLALGAFTAYVFNATLGLNLIVACVLALVVSAAAWGWGQNYLLWRPLRKRGTGLIAAMIVSIGLAMTIRYILLMIFGGDGRFYTDYAGQSGLEIGPVNITPKAIILSLLAILALTATVLWLRSSRMGKATRAVSDNPALASASGVNVERVIAVVWVLGATLAGFAGMFQGINNNVAWTMGQGLLLTMFAAIVLGGLGTIGGAIVGSFVVGMSVQLSTLIVPTQMKTGAALALMIVLLLIRPQGLLGKPERVG